MPQDYNQTIHLPKTEFPMRAGLPKREPGFLEEWEKKDLYHTMMRRNQQKKKFVLHDGPPYANGNLHMGHALNKILKDFIVRSRNMMGYQAPYVPGWDTHGLPIERQAIDHYGLKRDQVSTAEFRSKCEAFARSHVDNQREQFKRLGVVGDWERPYMTLTHDYEAAQIRVFGEMAKKGYIYKGRKPVYWCPHDETALAEAEIEYADDPCTTVFVKFPMEDDLGKLGHLDKSKLSFVIWTTTIWTLPGNLGIVLNPEVEYAIVRTEAGDLMIVAQELVESVLKKGGITVYETVETHPGGFFDRMLAKHPFREGQTSLIMNDPYVTTDAGTGCVHCAPAFGLDDFLVSKRYGITDFEVPVDEKGYHTAYAGKYAGLEVGASGAVILKDMEALGVLLGKEEIVHSYPHCWRCKNPILFRTTEQWFCSVDALKDKAIEACEKVEWLPGWGQERMTSMIRERADWCISRQRVWGVPIPIFLCKDCGKPLITEQVIDAVADLFEKEGSNAWFDRTPAQILPEGVVCACGSTTFTKEHDTMDVWFDSGSSWCAVMKNREQEDIPVDVYLEGNDQYRGWFQSSLLCAIATEGKAPYKTVITHGMIVDEERQKMSKSRGNGISPDDILKQYGADVMRLWVASADYRQDMRISKEMLGQISQSYLKIRNTARYILGNLFDFDPSKDSLAYTQLPELDRWALMRLGDLIRRVQAGYESYEFHTVTHAIHRFCVVDMSNFYLDILKDRLYCDEKEGVSRRAAQTVIYRILSALVRMLSPILCFTADEIWKAMPHEQGDEVENAALNDMPTADPAWVMDGAQVQKWNTLVQLRDEVNKALEAARNDKVIGKSLEADVTIYAQGELFSLLHEAHEQLADLCIVSTLTVASEQGTGMESEVLAGLTIAVARAQAEKCARCWKQVRSVGQSTAHPTLCARCAQVVSAQ